ncbi:hypothetical protein [Petroclostridium sp. X23]|uniref:hypothetical protein n=1 Tax=Petroclostridium sp. X23 TaxID=3045146 RepID=UPI0024AD20DC|nr:hypothetical protein [Petroclostridium sp. X23]WHH57746.1 hypothetical protein QKW49_18235 [Petroclostridium sp. X23]
MLRNTTVNEEYRRITKKYISSEISKRKIITAAFSYILKEKKEKSDVISGISDTIKSLV